MPGSGTGPSFEITSNRVRPRAMTLGSPWIRFAAPAMVGGRRRSDSPAELATPKGVARTNLEYMLRSVLPLPIPSAHCHLGNFFQQTDADNPNFSSHAFISGLPRLRTGPS